MERSENERMGMDDHELDARTRPYDSRHTILISPPNEGRRLGYGYGYGCGGMVVGSWAEA